MITITETAATKIKEIALAEGLENKPIRLKILGGGCAGFAYDLYFEEQTTPMDEIFETYELTLCVDPLSFQYLDGTEVDYLDRGIMGAGFKFINPNIKATCGCGSSVSF